MQGRSRSSSVLPPDFVGRVGISISQLDQCLVSRAWLYGSDARKRHAAGLAISLALARGRNFRRRGPFRYAPCEQTLSPVGAPRYNWIFSTDCCRRTLTLSKVIPTEKGGSDCGRFAVLRHFH